MSKAQVDGFGRLYVTRSGRVLTTNSNDIPARGRCCPCPTIRTCEELNDAWLANTPVTCTIGDVWVNMPDPSTAGCGPPYGSGWTRLLLAQTVTLMPTGLTGIYEGRGDTTFRRLFDDSVVHFSVRLQCGARPNEHASYLCGTTTIPARANGFDALLFTGTISTPPIGASLSCVTKDGLNWNSYLDILASWEFVPSGQTYGDLCCADFDIVYAFTYGFYEASVPISFAW